MANNMNRQYYRDRIRLVGVAYSGANPLADEVRKYLPADGDRQNVQGLIDACIEEARLDLIEIGNWIDDRIDKAYDDLIGLGDFVDEQLRQGALDLQHYIPYLRSNNVSVLEADDFTKIGLAGKADMPNGTIKEIFLRDSSNQSLRPIPCVPWSYRNTLIYESCSCEPVATISPDGSEFYFYPMLTGDATVQQVVLRWEGEKYDYQDTDVVPFDNASARVIANYVLAKLFHESIQSNPTARTHYETYAVGRRRLYTNFKRKTRLDGEVIYNYLPAWKVDVEDENILPIISVDISSVTVAAPNPATFPITVDTQGDATFSWEASPAPGSDFNAISDDSIYSGSSTATLSISNVTGLDQFAYRCKIQNDVGAIYSSEAILTVT